MRVMTRTARHNRIMMSSARLVLAPEGASSMVESKSLHNLTALFIQKMARKLRVVPIETRSITTPTLGIIHSSLRCGSHRRDIIDYANALPGFVSWAKRDNTAKIS